ncbi:unnamed protein product [Caenorhabditis angaria]|uniref:Xylulose kinase n=1 Tax=Caenorhabditis angaria TaxID=860376 RepID=A0A9P1II09_9PELO|nr:unnamed protein product [Caenorhabditis angaria]
MDDWLFLGIDLSTQQIKCVAINMNNEVVYRDDISFSNHEKLKEFKTKEGVHIKNEETGQTVTSPVKMWLKSIDILFGNLKRNEISERIQGISGCAQQHGTVYWKNGAKSILENLDDTKSLEEQFESAFSLPNSPIWMDSSTQKQCDELEKFIGGPEKLTKLTGSRAHHRFSGVQIKKVNDLYPEIYENTERISLISSFLTSVLIGKYCGIDWTDASGTNLMEIETKIWNKKILEFISPGLSEKLGKPVNPNTNIGGIDKFWNNRYSIPSTCQIFPFLGDNPSSLAGLSLNQNDIGISLGTSDTVFFHTNSYKYSIDAHVFAYNNEYMPLVCFKNGSLTRERALKLAKCQDWSNFYQILSQTPPGNQGKIGFFFDSDEIAPNVRKGDYLFNENGETVEGFDDLTTCRAIFESQCYLKLLYTKKMGLVLNKENRLILTGGASKNIALLQILSDVFNCEIYTIHVENSAALGGAMRAKYISSNSPLPYHQYFKNCNKLTPSATPIQENVQKYQKYFTNFEQCFERLK